MVIKVYVSSISGSMEIKKQQEFVAQILQTHKVEFDKVDITDPSNEEEKAFMRQHSIAKDGQKNALPPQIFNDSEYCGDYDALYDANECEEVLQFLKLEDEKPVSKASVILSEMNANEKGYVSGLAVDTVEDELETEQTTSKSEFSSAIADDHTDGSTSTTKVSSVTLGVLSAHSSDLNQNVSKPQESSASDDDEGVDELVEQDALTSDAAAGEQEEAPEVEPRAATKSEHRKSKDFHQYENVHLSTGTQELHVDNSTGSVEQGDALERHDDTLSLPDSIEGTTEKDGVGDSAAVEVSAEQ